MDLPLEDLGLSGRKMLGVPVSSSMLGGFVVACVATALALLIMAMQGRPLFSIT